MTLTTHTLDRFLYRDSILHRLDPRVKVLVTLLFVLSVLLLPDGAWLGYGLSWGLLFTATAAARLPYYLILKRALIVVPFWLAAITVIFNPSGEPVFAREIGHWLLMITDIGLVRFSSILIRSWLAVQAAILLTGVTQFPDLMHALTHLRVPPILVSIISFMYRYLFVLVDEAARLLRARQARSARLPGTSRYGGSFLWRAKVAGGMVGQLLSRSLDRSERVYQAMLARGYYGRLLTMNPHVITRQDWLIGGTAVLLIALVHMIARTL